MRSRQAIADFATAKTASLRGKRSARSGAALTEAERARRSTTTKRPKNKGAAK